MPINCHCERPSAAYQVIFSGDVVYTTVTREPSAVSQWIHDVSSLYGHGLIVGLDIEWRPNHRRDQQNPAATLQLCVGRCCLIYQLLHSPYTPLRLIQFLSYSNHNFVGVGVKSDLKKLQRDHRIGYNARTVDLRGLAAEVCEIKELKSAGLKSMARIVLGKEMEKPKSVTRSRWDNRRLTADQVRYACIDAFFSWVQSGSFQNLQNLQVFFPICYMLHYYVMCFDFKNKNIVLLDNSDAYDDKDLFKYGEVPRNLVMAFAEYLHLKKYIAKSKFVQPTKIDRLHMPWRNDTNVKDCGIYAMRHMETYFGQKLKRLEYGIAAKFTCGVAIIKRKILLCNAQCRVQ